MTEAAIAISGTDPAVVVETPKELPKEEVGVYCTSCLSDVVRDLFPKDAPAIKSATIKIDKLDTVEKQGLKWGIVCEGSNGTEHLANYKVVVERT